MKELIISRWRCAYGHTFYVAGMYGTYCSRIPAPDQCDRCELEHHPRAGPNSRIRREP